MLWIACLSVALAAAPDAPQVQVAQTEGPVFLDGRLDEPVWSRAQAVTEFGRFVPAPGGAPDEQIAVRFAQDADTLYIAIQVEQAVNPVRARLSPREDLNDDDQVGIYLDTFNDGRSGYVFYFNALGVQQDARWSYGEWNQDWNTVLRAEGQHDARGFTLEVALPFRSVRYAGGDAPQTWGLIVTRKIPAEGAKYGFPTLQRGHPQLFSQAARLQGVQPPPQRAQVELMPVLALRQSASREQAGEALSWSGLDPWHQTVWPALDARLALSADTRLAASLHPDFSQVEGDPSQLDLNQRFAFYFPERRPFFLEGVEAFQDPNETFYSRRVQAPAYGLKLVGRQGPFTLGVVNALDLAPMGSIHELGTPGFSDAELEGHSVMSSFARARIDLGERAGLGFSAGEKQVIGGAGMVVGALDLSTRLGETWTAAATGQGSTVFGADQPMSGAAWTADLVRSPAAGPGLALRLSDTTPGYRNEMAYLTQSGISNGELWGSWTFVPERGPDRITPGAWVGGRRERDGDQRGEMGVAAELVAGPTFLGGWASMGETLQSGVAVPNRELGLESSFNPVAWLDWYAAGRWGDEIAYSTLKSAHYAELSLGGTLRPLTWLRVDLRGQREWFTPLDSTTQRGLAGWGRVNAQLTRALGVRVIADYSTSTGVLSTSQLLSWVLHPGTEAYVGSTQRSGLGLTGDEPVGLNELSLFAKISVLWRGG